MYQTEAKRLRFLFLSGRCFVSSMDCLSLLLLRQFPWASSNHMFPINLNVSLFLVNCNTVGLSLVAPACRCMPKYFSSGSWHIQLLKKQETCGILKMVSNSSKNAETAHIHVYYKGR